MATSVLLTFDLSSHILFGNRFSSHFKLDKHLVIVYERAQSYFDTICVIKKDSYRDR